jgi:hypothetical protein
MRDNFGTHSTVDQKVATLRTFCQRWAGYTMTDGTTRVCILPCKSTVYYYDRVDTYTALLQAGTLTVEPPAAVDPGAEAAAAAAAAALDTTRARITTSMSSYFRKTWLVVSSWDGYAFNQFCQMWQGFVLTADEKTQTIPDSPSKECYAFLRTMSDFQLSYPATIDTDDVADARARASRGF